ncbi:predicted protein [Postia placenta Mad-698-R]|uniref:Uncharacterized protein n=1 Tax=Postia placenta MAD-698-R-SB12 TaxID=670580 RepID=A0A1X6N5S9_9APHY|nr:hypothetical protein POSPLADRAFT_1054502 [Postia placenta MAD-698-R-SB12]EED80695.1 predicted protein [Postia placenta Mad-698-R]EED81225.1 predicted protein [Postia placenta Mad-698-R]OSX63870.1 hypothetical protein POSPLADRAFT_1054502 [Postia placenta MAD-698-R-SB12]
MPGKQSAKYQITNYCFDVVAPDDNSALLTTSDLLTPVSVSPHGALPPSFILEKQDSGAFHVLIPGGPTTTTRKAIAFNNLLYAERIPTNEDQKAPSVPGNGNIEWEILSTVREGTSPDYTEINGIYMIAVEVVDLFTANLKDPIVERAYSVSLEPKWRPRQWLWRITPIDPDSGF